MDYMDLDVCCLKKAVKLNHSPTLYAGAFLTTSGFLMDMISLTYYVVARNHIAFNDPPSEMRAISLAKEYTIHAPWDIQTPTHNNTQPNCQTQVNICSIDALSGRGVSRSGFK